MQADNTVLSMLLSGCFEVFDVYACILLFSDSLQASAAENDFDVFFIHFDKTIKQTDCRRIERPIFCLSQVIAYPKLYLHLRHVWRHCLSLITGVTACL